MKKIFINELETETKKVLQDVENYLHDFESYPSEDDAIQYADEMERLENYYIEEREDGTSDNVIRLISRTLKHSFKTGGKIKKC